MFSADVLKIDAPQVADAIQKAIVEQVRGTLRRKGAVLGLSGGIDSSVVAALCAKALGSERVLGLFMPERDSSDDALSLGKLLAESQGIPTELENIKPALDGLGCYRRQDDAIRMVFEDYEPGDKFKITLPSILEGNRLNVFRLTIQKANGELKDSRMPPAAYLQLVAATNFKQRVRKMMEYYHADRLNYAVAGTPNRLEYDQGFFVKNGDGSADLKPIAHLYKTQVYALARHLGVPGEIVDATPSTDTYSLAQGQDEFYFALPWERMDLALWAHEHGVPAADLAARLGIEPAEAGFVYRDIESKRRATRYLHASPALAGTVAAIAP